MSAPVNLNKARKARNRIKKGQQADENAVKFGRIKAERTLEAARNENAKVALDRHRIEDE